MCPNQCGVRVKKIGQKTLEVNSRIIKFTIWSCRECDGQFQTPLNAKVWGVYTP